MEDLHNESPADLLYLLRDDAPALDRRSQERLKVGIETLLAENRDLAARAVRVELERDALLAAIGRQGFVCGADGKVVAVGPGRRNCIARALSGEDTPGNVPLCYPDGGPVRPEDLPGQRALRGEVLKSCRFAIHDRQVGDLHVAVSASPIFTDGAVSGAVVVWQDVTGEEMTRRRMEEANTLLEGLFENLGDIVGIQRPDHTILRYNSAGYEMLGMTPEEVHGRKCYELIGRTGPCTICATDHALASRRREVVTKYVPELGRYLECRSSPILNPQGEVALIVEQLYDITDRKRAEDKLRESEATARALLDAPEDMIVLLDTGGGIIDVNDMTVRRFSRSREDLIGMNIAGLFPPAMARADMACLHEVAESGSPGRFEGAWEGRWYTAVFYPVRDANGGVTRVAVIARDITDVKQAEDALRKRTHDLDERVKELSILYAISRIVEQQGVPLDDIFHEVVRALPSGWQYPEDTVVRITVCGRKFETEGFRATSWRQVSPVIVNGEPVGTMEVCYLRERPERDEGPFLREERSLIDTVARRLGRTIERLQTQESLQRSETKFREIAQQSFDMIYTCYNDGGIAYISPAVMRILGYTPTELIGERCRDYVVLSSLPAWEKGRKKIAAGEPVEGLEIEFRRKDGSAAFLELNESPIVHERTVVGVHVVGRDITERKQNEFLRQQAFEQIERNIEQFAVLGDHIRQPLQVILGMADLLDDGVSVEKIRGQVERINGYIRELDQGWIESRQVREFLRKHELA
ncbi:MAG: PAS domain S-box protein [Methanomicrobiaceae archaeon]|uniref:PAS domain-containing protein n=1 Tax=Methanoculleus sp. TaxID=90427 RepID=UPI00320E09CF|nr:PAS domain S-box protein [Methanomicrobiaceae archaeon]